MQLCTHGNTHVMLLMQHSKHGLNCSLKYSWALERQGSTKGRCGFKHGPSGGVFTVSQCRSYQRISWSSQPFWKQCSHSMEYEIQAVWVHTHCLAIWTLEELAVVNCYYFLPKPSLFHFTPKISKISGVHSHFSRPCLFFGENWDLRNINQNSISLWLTHFQDFFIICGSETKRNLYPFRIHSQLIMKRCSL